MPDGDGLRAVHLPDRHFAVRMTENESVIGTEVNVDVVPAGFLDRNSLDDAIVREPAHQDAIRLVPCEVTVLAVREPANLWAYAR